jgi:alkylated DNA nucleotide flippase Atl1
LSELEDDPEKFERECRKYDEMFADIKDHKGLESKAATTVLFNLVKAECEDSKFTERLCGWARDYLVEIHLKHEMNGAIERGEKLDQKKLDESLKTIAAPTITYIHGIFVHRLFATLLLLMNEGLGFASGKPMTIAEMKKMSAELFQWANYPDLKLRSGEGRSMKWSSVNLTANIMQAMASIANARTINYSEVAKKINEKNGTRLTGNSLARLVCNKEIDWKRIKKDDKTRRENVKKTFAQMQ